MIFMINFVVIKNAIFLYHLIFILMIFDIVLLHDHYDELLIIIIMILIFYVIFIEFFRVIYFEVFVIFLMGIEELNTCNLHKVVYDLLHNIVLINYYVSNIVYPLYY
jgi:hypothetical protein